MPDSIQAKKSLGQCFLVERSYAARIASGLCIERSDTILEIGPGRGILTHELVQSGANIIAVEIDSRLIPSLSEQFGTAPNFAVLNEDFLHTDLSELRPQHAIKVAGNLPYHLAAEVVFKLLDHARRARTDSHLPWISCAVLMMQKEVADRVSARPATKAWSRISVFTQLEARVHALLIVPAGAFRPIPKVDGGVIRIDFLRIPDAQPKDFSILERIIRYTFSQRRKMLKSSLSSLSGIHPHWQKSGMDFTRRPETLTPEEWVRLSDVISDAILMRHPAGE